MAARHLVLLELQDEIGNRGWGESWTNFPAWAPAERIAAFRAAFLPYMKGREVAFVPDFIRGMAKAFLGPARQSGTVAPLVASLCAVEMALIDLAAKRERVPISKLLFPSPESKVRIYASGIGAPIPWNEIDRYLDCGVTLFKLKIGFDDSSDLANIQAMKRHLGSRAKLAVDVNRNWTCRQAKEWLKPLADLEIQWLEEPLSVEEERFTEELAALSAVPLAGGENILVEPGGEIGAISASSFAVLQPDMTKYCTAHDYVRLLPEAAGRRKRVVPHFLASAPGQAFSLHLAAGCPDPLVEWDINPNPLRTDFFREEFHISGGMISIPEDPGLGWTPQAGRLRQD